MIAQGMLQDEGLRHSAFCVSWGHSASCVSWGEANLGNGLSIVPGPQNKGKGGGGIHRPSKRGWMNFQYQAEHRAGAAAAGWGWVC